jgi:hypothetical protein
MLSALGGFWGFGDGHQQTWVELIYCNTGKGRNEGVRYRHEARERDTKNRNCRSNGEKDCEVTVFTIPLQYRGELPNLRRVPTTLRLVQQRQHRMSTNRSQINTRTCRTNLRTITVETLEVLTVTMELTMMMIMSAIAVTMVVMIPAIAETTEP